MQYKKKIIGYSRYSMASLVSDLIKKASTLVGVNNDGDDGNGNNNNWRQGQQVIDLTNVNNNNNGDNNNSKPNKSNIKCELCTYENHLDALKCNMCGADLYSTKPSAPSQFQMANVIDLGVNDDDENEHDNRIIIAKVISRNSNNNDNNNIIHVINRTRSMELADELNVDRATARSFLNDQAQVDQQQQQHVATTTSLNNEGITTTTHTISIENVNNRIENNTRNNNNGPARKPSLKRYRSDELAKTLNVPIEEARYIIKEQENMDFQKERQLEQNRKDAELAQRMSMVIEKDCLCCLETFNIEEMYTLDCNKSHRVCFNCIKRSVEPAFQQRKLPRCPFGNECGHTLTSIEVIQIFGRNSKFHKLYTELEIQNTLASDTKSFLACPQPNCKDYCFADRPGSKEKAVCPTCKFEFCSLCKDKYHYRLSCAELGPTAERWFKWINEDSAKFRGEYNKAIKATEALKHAEEQFKNLQQDEKWKEQHCRLCPHCGKVIYRVDGCDSMTCGRDAADKGGGNKQDGCGKKFNWKQAKKYKRGADKAHLPKGLDQVDMELAKEIYHYLIRPENLGNGEKIETYRRLCDKCQEPIKGPRFACIHCPHQLNLCIGCQGKLTDGEFTLPTHKHDHLFQIFFESSYPEPAYPPLMEDSEGGWINLFNQQFTT